MQIECRAADDLEHISGSSLLLERFAQFIKQASVLDSDHGLVGERCDEIDLILAKRIYFGSHQREHANHGAFTQQRHSEVCSETERLLVDVRLVLAVGKDVINMNHTAIQRAPPNWGCRGLVPTGVGGRIASLAALLRERSRSAQP